MKQKAKKSRTWFYLLLAFALFFILASAAPYASSSNPAEREGFGFLLFGMLIYLILPIALVLLIIGGFRHRASKNGARSSAEVDSKINYWFWILLGIGMIVVGIKNFDISFYQDGYLEDPFSYGLDDSAALIIFGGIVLWFAWQYKKSKSKPSKAGTTTKNRAKTS